MLSREQRLQQYFESRRESEESGFTDFSKLLSSLEDSPPSSEERFEELRSQSSAVLAMKAAAIEFGRNARLEVKAITNPKAVPSLPADSWFKYSPPGGGSFGEFKWRMEKGEEVLIFVVQEGSAVIGYGLVDVKKSNGGREVKIIDVEHVSRRSYGFATTIHIEDQPFDVGVAHLLVTSIVNHFEVRLYTDATHGSSRYAFKSAGFLSYSGNNPCLLETRP